MGYKSRMGIRRCRLHNCRETGCDSHKTEGGYTYVRIMLWGLNSIYPSDAIWRHISGSILDRVMACCLKTLGYYLNCCWPIIREVFWHRVEGKFSRNAKDIYHWYEYQITNLRPLPHIIGVNGLAGGKDQRKLQLQSTPHISAPILSTTILMMPIIISNALKSKKVQCVCVCVCVCVCLCVCVCVCKGWVGLGCMYQ